MNPLTVVERQEFTTADDQPVWHFALRVLFRFAFVYVLLYFPIQFLQFTPHTYWMTKPYEKMWDSLAQPVGRGLFHFPSLVMLRHPTGSGDTALDYCAQFNMLIVAFVGGVIWTLLDRKRIHYVGLHGWLRLVARYALACAMFIYGFDKLVPAQFGYLTPDALTEPYGQFSPMGVLWKFMAASPAYTIFGGAAELLAGALLVFRRTALLGALIAAGVMTNIVALNFCYDVPVKLYSLNLLGLAVLVAAADWRRLVAFFLANRFTPAAKHVEPRWTKSWQRVTAISVKVAFLGWLLYETIFQVSGYYRVRHDSEKEPLVGLFNVDRFEQNGQVRPPLTTDRVRWHLLSNTSYSAYIAMMDGSRVRYIPKFDRTNQEIAYTLWGGGSANTLHYQIPRPSVLLLSGKWGNDSIAMELHKLENNDFPLTTRGFHWVQEDPFNR